MIHQTEDEIAVKGKIRAVVGSPDLAPELYAQIVENSKNGVVDRALISQYNEKAMVASYDMDNIVPTVGRTLFSKALTGNLSALSNILVNYSALGTGTSSPAAGNTQLGTEVYRKLVASLSYADNIAYLTAFYLAADTNGTYYEHGMFANASGTANSGTLISRVLLNAPTGVTKSAIQTLTIEHQITFSV